MPPYVINLLVVQNKSQHLELLRRKFGECEITLEITSFHSGNDAIAYLDGRTAMEATQGRTLPSLIFIDLDLPGESETQILKHIRSNPRLRTIPVVVNTVSGENEKGLETFKEQGTLIVNKGWDEKALDQTISQLRQSGILKS